MEEAESPAISSIVSSIKESTDVLSVQYINNLDDFVFPINEDTGLIMLGAELLAQSHEYTFTSRSIGGGFYEPITPAPSITTISLFPNIGTIADEIIKTGFDLRTLTTVTTNNQLKIALENNANSLVMNSINHVVKTSQSERGVARTWFDILKNIDPATEALYVSDGRYIESSGAYKEILEQAWRRNIMVVSALPQFSRRGVSIGFLPDLSAYARALVERADPNTFSNIKSPPESSNVDLEVLFRVYNQRTLTNIGYLLPPDIDRLKRDDIVVK